MRGPPATPEEARAGHTSRKSVASTTMILSGTFLFVFVLLHLVTFKYGPHYDVGRAIPAYAISIAWWSRCSAGRARWSSTSSAW